MASRVEQMVGRLKDLQAISADIEASAAVSVDGLNMASTLSADVEEDHVPAVSAAMLSLGDRIATEQGSCPWLVGEGMSHPYRLLESSGRRPRSISLPGRNVRSRPCRSISGICGVSENRLR